MLKGAAFNDAEHDSFFWDGAGDSAALLIHGFPGTPLEMQPLARMLHHAGWTTQGLLLPGFGPQIEMLLEHSYDDWLEAALQALTVLRESYGRVLVVGNSMGGALAIAAAARVPVDGVVLVAPFWKLDHVLWQMLPALRLIFPTFPIFRLVKLDFSDPETQRGIRQFLPDADLSDPDVQTRIRDYRLPIKVFNEIRTAGMQAHRAAPMVRAPALIFQGMRDDLVQPQLTRQLAGRLGGPARLVEIDAPHDISRIDAGGWAQIEAALMDFVVIGKAG